MVVLLNTFSILHNIYYRKIGAQKKVYHDRRKHLQSIEIHNPETFTVFQDNSGCFT